MPMPMIVQASARLTRPEAIESTIRPAAKNRLVAASTSRPPWRSIMRPAAGPNSPDSSREAENIPKNQVSEICRLLQIGAAMTAGR